MVMAEKVTKIIQIRVNFWNFEIHREIPKFNLITSYMIFDWKTSKISDFLLKFSWFLTEKHRKFLGFSHFLWRFERQKRLFSKPKIGLLVMNQDGPNWTWPWTVTVCLIFCKKWFVLCSWHLLLFIIWVNTSSAEFDLNQRECDRMESTREMIKLLWKLLFTKLHPF